MRTDVSRETREILQDYANELRRWTRTINLISPKTVDDIEQRHIEDSSQIFQLSPTEVSTWCDLGSGGGLPGIVLAAHYREANPKTKFCLIESDKRKCAFLRMMASRFSLNVEVLQCRIEDAPPQNSSIVSARALAPLTVLMKMAMRHVNAEGLSIFPKGADFAAEIEHAKRDWEFDFEAHSSQTDDNSKILLVSNLKRRALR